MILFMFTMRMQILARTTVDELFSSEIRKAKNGWMRNGLMILFMFMMRMLLLADTTVDGFVSLWMEGSWLDDTVHVHDANAHPRSNNS